jgi:Ser/Thr protein kinase RdoA (MazF antagonist)
MNTHPYDALTPDRVIDAVEAAGYRSDCRLLALNSYENRVYQVGIEDAQPLIAKFYRPERWSAAQILEEHAFSLELAEAEIPVVAPLRAENGETLHRHEGFLFALFPRRGGHPPELDNMDNLLVLGRTLGRIHRVGAAAPFVHRLQLQPQQMLVENCEYLLREWIPRDLRPAFESLSTHLIERILPLWEEVGAGDLIRVHGDCHVGNILWRDDCAHFVDLDDCCSAPAVQDLWMFLSGERPQRQLQLAELLAGYEEFHDFAPRQLRWVEALCTLRIVRHAAWLGRRWEDPAFPRSFPWFAGERFWANHILELREQLAALDEPPLQVL